MELMHHNLRGYNSHAKDQEEHRNTVLHSAL